ncbi:hypothetical protein QOK74_07965 [Staphylococcus saprophyticus]|uniref:hypothetical protein n=1 Tax=Staphylococcus saprophyticus TaxID=29385 RepID=UPI0024C289E2|nr:hypothetical protein [Staphylococcus saprophyticus]MDK1672805.1 hypothetical protein [Staphylococcus saprophyticus]
MKIEYNRPLNLQDINDQLKAMQAANSVEHINQLISDIDWLIKEDVGMYKDKYHALALDYGTLRNDYDELESNYHDLMIGEDYDN